MGSRQSLDRPPFWRRTPRLARRRYGRTLPGGALFIGKAASSMIGLFLVVSGGARTIETFSVSDEAGQRSTYLSAFCRSWPASCSKTIRKLSFAES